MLLLKLLARESAGSVNWPRSFCSQSQAIKISAIANFWLNTSNFQNTTLINIIFSILQNLRYNIEPKLKTVSRNFKVVPMIFEVSGLIKISLLSGLDVLSSPESCYNFSYAVLATVFSKVVV